MIARLSDWHQAHAAARAALTDVFALPAHALVEAYSILTRLPGGRAIPPAAAAAAVLAERFPGQPLGLAPADRGDLLSRLSGAAVFGGATYDGLVGLEAAAHGCTLLTLDTRAAGAYRLLGVDFRLLAP